MDPVQKAVINHTFGVPQPLKKKQIISCNICHLRFNSTVRNVLFAEVVGRYGRERDGIPDCVIYDIKAIYTKVSLAAEKNISLFCASVIFLNVVF